MDKQQLINYLSTLVTPAKLKRFETILSYRTNRITLVLEDIYQSHNISASLRSAECFGITQAYIIEQTHRFSVNINVTKGASEWMTLHRYREPDLRNTQRCYADLKQRGYKIVATSPHPQGVMLNQLPEDFFTEPCAFVFGTEETGLSPYALEHADAYLTIPMYGFTQSFNISVSVALVLYQCVEDLRNSGYEWQLSEQEKQEYLLAWLRRTISGVEEHERRFLANFESKDTK